MKTWIRIALAAWLGGAGCSHPKPTETPRPVSDEKLQDEVDRPWTIGEVLGLAMQLSVDTLIESRSSGFANERIGDGVRGRDWIEFPSRETLPGFHEDSCSIRWLRGLFDEPPADLWVYGCSARIPRGGDGDEAFDWIRDHVGDAIPEAWTRDEGVPGTREVRFHEPGSRLHRLDFGDVEVRREPLTFDSDLVTVSITAVVPVAGT